MKPVELHKDGTITYWSVYLQQYRERVWFVPDRELAAMGEEERERTIKHMEDRRARLR